jgi:hypothetical protein
MPAGFRKTGSVWLLYIKIGLDELTNLLVMESAQFRV